MICINQPGSPKCWSGGVLIPVGFGVFHLSFSSVKHIFLKTWVLALSRERWWEIYMFIFSYILFHSISLYRWGLAKWHWRSTDLHYCPPSAWSMFFTMVMKWRCLETAEQRHRPWILHLRPKHPGHAHWLDHVGLLMAEILANHGWQYREGFLLCLKKGAFYIPSGAGS